MSVIVTDYGTIVVHETSFGPITECIRGSEKPSALPATHAADLFDDIRARVASIKADEAPRATCPLNTGRDLWDCLRSSSVCPESCPHREVWTGPIAETA